MRLNEYKTHAAAAVVALSALLSQGCATAGRGPVMQQGAARESVPGGLPSSTYASLERGVIDELNRVRSEPARYAEELERDLQYYQGDVRRRPDETPLQTREGVAAVREAIRVLRQSKPVPRLKQSTGMTLAARDHVMDQAPLGHMDHRGTDGSMAWDRVSRYGEWKSKISENMTFGPATPHDVVAGLLIDDGIADRGHRKNVLDPEVKVVGISCGPHKTYRVMCDMVHAGGFVENQTAQR